MNNYRELLATEAKSRYVKLTSIIISCRTVFFRSDSVEYWIKKGISLSVFPFPINSSSVALPADM